MTLSVIIPNHNEKRIAEVRNSVFRYFPHSQIIICDDPHGNGKGWAIRNGIKVATGDLLCFIDGDYDIDPINIFKLLRYIYEYDIVVAKKSLKNLPIYRLIISIGYRVFIKILFGLPFETQTGLKIWKRKALQQFIANDFSFDVEMLYKAHKRGFKVKEVPVFIKSTKIPSIKSIWKTLKSTIQVRFLS